MTEGGILIKLAHDLVGYSPESPEKAIRDYVHDLEHVFVNNGALREAVKSLTNRMIAYKVLAYQYRDAVEDQILTVADLAPKQEVLIHDQTLILNWARAQALEKETK